MIRAIAAIAALATCAVASPSVPPPLRLVAPADDAALHAVREATRTLALVRLDAAQSFRIVAGNGHAATLVAGRGQQPGATYPGCFAALVQRGRTLVVPTIGTGNWEAETCSRALATGVIPLRKGAGTGLAIGVVYEAFSPNASVREPIILYWNRDAGTWTVDEARSNTASIKGATTIAAMRRLFD